MTPDTYAVRDSTGRPVAFYDSRELAQYDTERYPGGTVVGLVGVDRLGDERLVDAVAKSLMGDDELWEVYPADGIEHFRRQARHHLAALRAELEES